MSQIKKIIKNKRQRLIYFSVFGLIFNLIYAFWNGRLGIISGSLWFIFSCFYHLVLGGMKFLAVIYETRVKNKNEVGVAKTIGFAVISLSLILAGILYISISRNRSRNFGTIVMITIATYTFSKIVLAIISAVKRDKSRSPILSAIDCIRYIEIAVSVFTMQQSMLVSFGGMKDNSAIILNYFTGTAIWIFTIFIGIYLIIKKEIK